MPIGGGAICGGMPIGGGTPIGGIPAGGIPAGGAYIALFWRAVPELWRLLRPAAAPSRSETIIALAGCNTLESGQNGKIRARGVLAAQEAIVLLKYSAQLPALLVGALLAFWVRA